MITRYNDDEPSPIGSGIVSGERHPGGTLFFTVLVTPEDAPALPV